MTPAEAWAAARRQITEGLKEPVADAVHFVDDEHVSYELPHRIQVSESDLFGLDDEHSWDALLVPPPTWLHFNLLKVDDGTSVVTLRRSHGAMPPGDDHATSINVSAERTRANVAK